MILCEFPVSVLGTIPWGGEWARTARPHTCAGCKAFEAIQAYPQYPLGKREEIGKREGGK